MVETKMKLTKEQLADMRDNLRTIVKHAKRLTPNESAIRILAERVLATLDIIERNGK